MPVVRCYVHNVPYNDENPRGCPACWQDKVGKDPAGLMKELARASQAIPRVEILPPPTDEELPPMERLRTGAWPTPVTPPPRLPAPEPTRSERLAQTLRTHAVAVTSVGLVTVAVEHVVGGIMDQRTSTSPGLLRKQTRSTPVDRYGLILFILSSIYRGVGCGVDDHLWVYFLHQFLHIV